MNYRQVLVVEDEKLARDQFIDQLRSIGPEFSIAGETSSVKQTVAWLRNNHADLIFLDIHLGDSSCFEIFKQIKVETPIIFITAYDQYALDAFQVNSIDYLLKPVDDADLKRAIDKYKNFNSPKMVDWEHLEEVISQKERPQYKERFLVKKGQQLASIPTKEICYFEVDGRYVNLNTRNGNKYLIDLSLSDLEGMLDPLSFYRLNRSYITHIDAIVKIISLSKSKLKITLAAKANKDVIVSADKSGLFKSWLSR